ncbi:MAG TPA: VIT domain-containing protein [Pseudonocardiaceae bacterium]|nr:VIT domain-containing protein [Pseudonocardiaceae bacterium]
MTTHVDLMTADELARHADPIDDAGTGTLGTERGNLPMDAIDLRARITGLATEMELTQSFRNTFDEPLEATYIFPLPDRAAVTGLRMTAADRVIDGVLKERGEARADYDQALAAGQRTSIAEEERPGVFTMRVGNIMPDERVTVRLTLAGRLPFEDGEATFRFPLVVAPRYIPGTPLPGHPVGDGIASDTDEVPDASRITPPVLLPNFPNPVRLSAQVDIDPAGLPLRRVSSSLHVTTIDETDANRCQVRLTPGERVNRDFILRLGLGADDAVAGSLAVVPDTDGDTGTFALTVLPPMSGGPAKPRDVVLVLDRSGSMDGWKMVAARRAAARIVDTFTLADRFTVLAFDNVTETAPGLPSGLVAATDRNRFRAIEHLAGLIARGGTELRAPLVQATGLLATADTARERVIVLVTDGQVGNEDHILHDMAPLLGGIRVHTVGIDTAVNVAFLQRLASLGGGRCELVESEDRLDDAMRHIHRRIGQPLVTDLRLAGLSIDEDTIAPAGLPDLYPGAPVVISGRYRGTPGVLTVTGQQPDGIAWHTTVAAAHSGHAGLRAVWARAHVRDLEDRYVTSHGGPLGDLERRIVAVSLEFGVLCRFTAFVAVDKRVANETGAVHRITQPVEIPQGWDMAAGAAAPMLSSFVAPAPMPMPMRPGGKARVRAAAKLSAPGALPQAPSAYHFSMHSEPAPAPEFGATPTEASKQDVVLVSMRAFVEQALERLRLHANDSFSDRVRVLVHLAEDIRRRFDPGYENDLAPESLRVLSRLGAELATPCPDDATLDKTWQSTVDTLMSLIAPAPSQPTKRVRPFWKR